MERFIVVGHDIIWGVGETREAAVRDAQQWVDVDNVEVICIEIEYTSCGIMTMDFPCGVAL